MTTGTVVLLRDFLNARYDEVERDARDSIGYCHSTGDYKSARVLERFIADIAAARAVVELHSGDNDEMCQSYAGNWAYEPCPTLRALTLPYRRHHHFREEWLA